MNQRFVLVFALCAPGVVGCFQELDTTAAKKFPTDPDAGPPIMTGGIDIECINASGKCSNPCEATTVQARDILTNHCGVCHNGPGQGAPFDFILDFDKLKTERSLKPAAEFPPMDPLDPAQKMRFLVPGIPENSWIFVRLAIKGDMPPPGAVQHPNPKPTISDQSVLSEWITTCMGPSERPAGGTGGASGTGGSTGSGGMTGTGGATGAGGRAGTGGATAAGGTTGGGGRRGAGGAGGA